MQLPFAPLLPPRRRAAYIGGVGGEQGEPLADVAATLRYSAPMITPPSWSRRRLLAGAAAAPIAALATGYQAQILTPAKDGDVRAVLQDATNRGDVTVAATAQPYRLSGPIRVPGGRRLRFEPGTRLAYTGPVGAADAAAGVFLIEGDDVTIAANGGEVTIEAATESPYLWAVVGRGVARLTVAGIRGVGCAHVRLTATETAYADIATVGEGRHVCRDVTIIGGGATFRTLPAAGEGACYIAYTLGWSLRDATYERVAHGVQWWGGNAWPGVADGAPANERKCTDFTIRNVSVRQARGGGIWGSMGSRGRVEDCRVEDCGDVGFDAEGCWTVSFSRCHARDATNGCFTTFFLCRDIVFANCTGLVTERRRPLFRCYNNSQSSVGTGLVAIRGGRFACADPTGAGSIDTASGPTARFEITGATLVNVSIDTAHYNMHDTRIAGNRLTFPDGAPVGPAIRAGAAKSLGGAGTTVVADNRIEVAGTRPSPASAIHLIEDDYNSSAADIVRGNLVSPGFAQGITVENASANVGMHPRFRIEDNVLAASGSSIRVLTRAGSPKPLVSLARNRRGDGRAITAVDR